MDKYFMVSRFCVKRAEDFDNQLNEYIKTLEQQNPDTEIFLSDKTEQTEDEEGVCYTITLGARKKL